jgi:hypothetical protein
MNEENPLDLRGGKYEINCLNMDEIFCLKISFAFYLLFIYKHLICLLLLTIGNAAKFIPNRPVFVERV